MTREQAINMLRFIADLYKVVNAPDVDPALAAKQAAEAMNGQGHVHPEDIQQPMQAPAQ